VNAFNRVVVVVILIAAYLAVLARGGVSVCHARLDWCGGSRVGRRLMRPGEAGSPYVYVGIRVAVVVAVDASPGDTLVPRVASAKGEHCASSHRGRKHGSRSDGLSLTQAGSSHRSSCRRRACLARGGRSG